MTPNPHVGDRYKSNLNKGPWTVVEVEDRYVVLARGDEKKRILIATLKNTHWPDETGS